MTTSGHDGEHSGAMDRIKSVWREAIGAREEHHDGGADNGQAWGGQHAPPGANGGTGPVTHQGPPRMPHPGHPQPQQNAPQGPPQAAPERDNGSNSWSAPEATVAQSVPWQAPRPMPQPVNQPPAAPQPVGQQQINPQQVAPWQPQRPAPLPQRGAPQRLAPLPPLPQPVPQAPPLENGGQPGSAQTGTQQDGSRPGFVEPVTVHAPVPIVENLDLTEAADPPTTWQPPVPAASPEQAADTSPTDAGPAGRSAAPVPDDAAPEHEEAAAELDEEVDEESEQEPVDPPDERPGQLSDPGRMPDGANAWPAEPARRPVWTAPELITPRPPTGADRAGAPDRPTPVHSPAPVTPDRIPGQLPSHLPSHITDAAAGLWTRQQNGASAEPQGRHELFDAPYPEAEPMSHPEPVTRPPFRAVPTAPPAAPADPAPAPANSERFVPKERADEYAGRWGAVKSEFVDEPRAAVRKADALVGELLDDIKRALTEQRAQLDRGLDTDGTSTEDLRQAMHRYREFFDRLLIL